MENGIFEIRGAAGAGKTHQLVKDIHFLYDNNHSNIAVLSFSNAAVDELSGRLVDLNVTPSTLHSFCWKVIGTVSKHILDSIDLLSKFKPEGLQKSHNCTLKDVKTVQYGEIGIPQFNPSTGELWLSHDDVISLFIEALEWIPNFKKMISGSFDYILIDEYQDTNGDFLNMLFKKLSKLLTIGLYGDPFQTVYLNDKTINIASEKQKYGIKTFNLPYNYRSQANLVNLYNQTRERYDGLEQKPKNNVGSMPQVFLHSGSITLELVSLINRQMNFESSVILSTTNRMRVSAAGFGPIAAKIYDWIPTPKHGYTDWSEVLHKDRLSPYVTALIEYGNLLFGSDYSSVCALLTLFTKKSVQNVDINSIKELLHQEKEKQIVTVEGYEELGLQFTNEINNDFTNKLNLFTFSELKKVVDLYNLLDDINDQSMTFFSSKGLEFNNVILNIDFGNYWKFNWNKIDFNHSENDKIDLRSDIMLYLFYVGITRAKHGLAIFVNTDVHSKFENNLKNKFPRLLKYKNI